MLLRSSLDMEAFYWVYLFRSGIKEHAKYQFPEEHNSACSHIKATTFPIFFILSNLAGWTEYYIVHFEKKKNRSQKNVNSIYSLYSFSGIVPKDRAQDFRWLHTSKGFHDKWQVLNTIKFQLLILIVNPIFTGSEGQILPAATLNLNNFCNIWANAKKLQEFFRNLSEKNLMWSISVH